MEIQTPALISEVKQVFECVIKEYSVVQRGGLVLTYFL